MSRILQKLHTRRGETLVESLAAILVLALSSAMLAVMVTTAVRINVAATKASAQLYKEISAVEQGAGTDSVPVAVVFEDETIEITADYTGAAEDLYAYALPAKGAN